jgi:threonine dehydrogenase-like Zn-dependent dehydrogenase
MGADRVVNPLKEDLKEVVYEMTDGLGAEIVVDAVGSLILDAMKAVGDGGTILLFGLNDKARAEIAQNDITSRDLTIKGNFIGQFTLRNVANVLKYDLDDYTGMITHELPLSRFGEGLEAMRSGKALEVILYPDRFME